MTIRFSGEIVREERDGARQVRLENRHLVTAHPPRCGTSSSPPALGDRVMIEMAPDEMRGWRLLRRP